ncbi:MAG: GNAT family N-acetyltransferase [Cyanobacteria bacterium J06642_2]
MANINFTCTAIAAEAERQWYSRLLAHCFQSTPAAEMAYLDRVGLANGLLVRQGDMRAGGLVKIPMGQWFGEKRVPMTGIASVAIAPEYRGRGAALALMRHAVSKLYEDGVALSVLYPAVQTLYRRVGYEQGGSYCSWEIATESLNLRGGDLSVRAVAVDDTALVRLYSRQAQARAGNLDRHRCIWQQKLVKAETEPLYAYIFGDCDREEGYVLYRQETTPNGAIASIEDWCVLTAAATQQFWSFWAAHRSQINQIRWHGSPLDDLTMVLPEQRAKPRFSDRWLLRIIDVERALSARGYPLHITVELHLDIRDELIPSNNDRFILRVAGGGSEVQRGGTGALKLSVSGLAPMYSGFRSANQLCRLGFLEGDEEALAIATQLFAGPSPWMPDFF